MKNDNKPKPKNKLKAVSVTLSEDNIKKIDRVAKEETRGNRSLWLDTHITLFFGEADA